MSWLAPLAGCGVANSAALGAATGTAGGLPEGGLCSQGHEPGASQESHAGERAEDADQEAGAGDAQQGTPGIPARDPARGMARNIYGPARTLSIRPRQPEGQAGVILDPESPASIARPRRRMA